MKMLFKAASYVVCGGDEMRPAKITLFPPSTFSGPPSENCLCFEYLMINKNIVKTSVNVVAVDGSTGIHLRLRSWERCFLLSLLCLNEHVIKQCSQRQRSYIVVEKWVGLKCEYVKPRKALFECGDIPVKTS